MIAGLNNLLLFTTIETRLSMVLVTALFGFGMILSSWVEKRNLSISYLKHCYKKEAKDRMRKNISKKDLI